MQTITMYLRAASVKAALVDAWNQPVSGLPALTRGLRAELVLKLLGDDGQPLPPGKLDYASWDFAVANDWDTSTTPQLRVTEGIAVEGSDIHIPLTETNTEELVAALGKSEQMQFGCELAGFSSGETTPEFLIQFDVVIRNRRADAGTGRPGPVGDASYTAAQVRALFAARMEVQLSDDGTLWYDAAGLGETPAEAAWYRFRNAAVGHDWSDPLPLLRGAVGATPTLAVGEVRTGAPGSAAAVDNSGTPTAAKFDFTIPQGPAGEAASVAVGTVESLPPGSQPEIRNAGTSREAVFDFKIPEGARGATGEGSHVYVAYASESDGTGFSLVPSAALKYRAEIMRTEPLANPSAEDFLGAAWVKYLGDDATVYGDVLVADADTSVAKVTRIVFENARIRKGVDGEVIVNFKEAGVTDEEMDRYAVVNGRTRLSSWTNGGGSPAAMPGLEIFGLDTEEPWTEIGQYSTFIGTKET